MFDSYQYGEAGRQIDDFLWGEFADWYIEISKHALYQGDAQAKASTRRVLLAVLDTSLRLLHPFMPFVTEELWSFLPGTDGKPLIVSGWATADESYIDEQAETETSLLIELVRGIRNVREEYNVEPGRRITALIMPGSRRGCSRRTITCSRGCAMWRRSTCFRRTTPRRNMPRR
ncbi:MAG: class I tRNA ligase family protein [Anaerolineae bacterium]